MTDSEVSAIRDTMPSKDGCMCFPELMTEAEVIQYLRIPEISTAQNYHFVIENLKRMKNLPRITICNKNLYPLGAVREWVDNQVKRGN